MVMIGHQTIGDDRHAISLAISLNQTEAILIVAGVEEDQAFTSATVVNMVVMPLGKSIASVWHFVHLVAASRRF